MAIYCKNLHWRISIAGLESAEVDPTYQWLGDETQMEATVAQETKQQLACIHFITGLVAILQNRLVNMKHILDVFVPQPTSGIIEKPVDATHIPSLSNSLSHGLLLTLRYTLEEASIAVCVRIHPVVCGANNQPSNRVVLRSSGDRACERSSSK